MQALQIIKGNIERNDAETKKQLPSYRPFLENIQHYACIRQFNIDAELTALKKQHPEKDQKDIEDIVKRRKKYDDMLPSVLKEIGINVLRYEQHIKWMEWFERIRKNRREEQIAKVDPSSFPSSIRN